MKQLERQGPVRSKGHEAFLGVAMLGHRGGSFHRVKRVCQEAQRLRSLETRRLDKLSRSQVGVRKTNTRICPTVW
jgi:hypothetical protein